MNTRLFAGLMTVGLTVAAAAQTPLGTAFTYQGQVKLAGAPLNDTADFQFTLWDAATLGNPVAGPVAVSNVAVTNGLFTAQLDFGVGVFNGDARWLEIAVRTPAGSGSFTTLAPRQPLTAAPYALYALNAPTGGGGTVTSVSQGAGITLTPNPITTTGSVAIDPAVVPRLGAANTFTGANTFSAAPAFAAAGAPFTVSSTTNVANLNADLLDGVDSSAFLTAIPVPLTLSGNSATHIIRGENTSTAAGSAGVWGVSTGSTGLTYGVYGVNTSANGIGVFGGTTGSSGATYGVYALDWSFDGCGLYAEHGATSGVGPAVYGRTMSATNFAPAIHGVVDSTTPGGYSAGVRGQNNGTGPAGIGVWGSHAGSGWGGYFTSVGGRGVYALVTATSGETWGVYAQADSSQGTGVAGVHNSTAGDEPGVFGVSYSNSTYATGVLGQVSPTSAVNISAGVRGINNATGDYGLGVLGSHAGGGVGVSGVSLSGAGVYGSSQTGWGVRGRASANSGATYGVSGEADSPDGTGVAGFHVSASGDEPGVMGSTNSVAPYAAGVAGYVGSSSPGSYSAGVRGQNSGTGGTGVGVWGSHDGGGWGVYGTTVSGTGLYGWASASSGTNYGVYGGTNSSTSGYGVYSWGRFAATGTKSFQMDHPLDPENKYLNHFCTEGPEPLNVYSGNVVTDERGYATVTLPAYFDSINRDFRYQLTVVDDADRPDFVQAKVAQKIRDNRFVVRTSAPTVEVSWRVEAVRNDRWVQAYGFNAEAEKPAEHQGKYLNPELYGQPAEMAAHYQDRPR